MKNRALPSQKSETDSISVSRLEAAAESYYLSGEIAQHSPATLSKRRLMIGKLLWFLREKKIEECNLLALRQFFAYLSDKKPIPGGRWGNPQSNTPAKSSTVATYHATIRALFSWLVEEGEIDASPLDRIPSPCDRPDQVQPFTTSQVNALLTVAKKSQQPERDQAILLFMLDTAVRASELCAIQFKDIDMTARRVTVEGKGGKARTVSFQKTTAKALFQYLKIDGREDTDPLFFSERGEALTRNGLRLLFLRLGKVAKISSTRCSPHTMRHTSAVEFLRAGGNTFTLQTILGHTDLKMTQRYVSLAQADVENQQRQYSPVERLKSKK